MKKILKRGLLVLLALCTGYTVVASALLHGLGAYRVNTSFGQILAFSRQITLPVTVLLWVIALVADKRWLSRRRGTARGQSGPIPTAAPKSAPAHPTVPDASGPVSAEKIPPKTLVDSAADTATELLPEEAPHPAAAEKISPKAPAAPAADTATELLPEEAPNPTATEKIPPKAPAAPAADTATELLPEEAPNLASTEKKTPKVPAACPQCGAVVKPGAKFCMKCGYRLGGQA